MGSLLRYILLVWALSAAPLWAQKTEVLYAAIPSWVNPPPNFAQSGREPEGQGAFSFLYIDSQHQLSEKGLAIYSAYRVRVVNAQGLSMGNVMIEWNPNMQQITVHKLLVHRGGQAIEVLKMVKLVTIPQEAQFEQSILNGSLVSGLQIPDLRIGDEIEFAWTLQTLDKTIGNRPSNIHFLAQAELRGTHRLRLVWPKKTSLTWTTSPDFNRPEEQIMGTNSEIMLALQDPGPPGFVNNAPKRNNLRRFIEYSTFASWKDIAGIFSPLFEKAAQLEPSSPLLAEIAKINAASDDPKVRMQAALRVVQSQIRYVYVGLDGGNLRPATAEETWSRRFGDCKGKSVLLIALLNRLGIAAEPVLVNTKAGDVLPDRLPSPNLFDHVLVRAKIGDKSYWLDGTKLTDPQPDLLAQPNYRWGLPLSPNASALIELPPEPPIDPLFLAVLDMDAGAGFGQPAKLKYSHIFRGEQAITFHSNLSVMGPTDAQNALRQYWSEQNSWSRIEDVSWAFNEERGALSLSATGTLDLDWDGDDEEGRSLTIPGAGFYPPDKLERPKEQNQKLPWAVEFPAYRCWATTIRLPKSSAKWRWDYSSKDVDTRLAGVSYFRRAELRNNVMRTIMSRRALVPEISADVAASDNARIPNFDNSMSSVYQAANKAHHTVKKGLSNNSPVVAADEIEWDAPNSPCRALP